MAKTHGLDRRAFLKGAGMTALAGAVGAPASFGATALAGTAPGSKAADLEYDFDTVYNRIGTDCVKWDRQIERFGKDKLVVGMGIADMDFKTAPCIGEALAKRCEHENWGYMDIPDSFYEAIADWNRRRYGLEIDPETIVLSAGVHDGLLSALRAFSPPGTKVLLTTPTYNGFYSDLRLTKTIPVDSPMKLVDGRYSIDFDDLESRIDYDTHTLILCNPQNPTGNCWSEEDLMRLGEMCLKHRIVVLSDEIHCDFVTKGNKYTPFASLPDKDIVDNSITFKAVSKSFSISAMKTAWFFSTNPKLLERVKAIHHLAMNTLGIVANHAALTEGEEWLEQLLVYIDGNHDFAERYIRENIPLVKFRKPEGTYLAWLDVAEVIDRIGAKETAAKESEEKGESVTPEEVLERWLVEHAGVQLNPGSSYGTGGEGHMRMNLATSRKLVQLALENMAKALATI